MNHLIWKIRPHQSGSGMWVLNPQSEKLFRALWQSNTITVEGIRKRLKTEAGEGAIRRIARDLGLGRKAQNHGPARIRDKKGRVAPRKKEAAEGLPKGHIEAWPDDMPHFTDDPRPVANRRL